ncbi:type IV pilin protein [Algiphilus sp. W345]|uniref:Type IV pilin protein n=1 Tax=Banduia mediterranea TaxID=3075609 RepID=A0ABU2WEM8_9GAMM|nr:type IV pilin protein [Algiphilus sp. W345]MDT0496325.1 type IV pilin protein [Algiphilus sp. W345]
MWPSARHAATAAGPARHELGVTLIELMIAVAVVGILAMIAYPSYVEYRLRADRALGQKCLIDALGRAESYYTRIGRYPESANEIFPSAGNAYSCGNEGLYRLSIESEADCPSRNCVSIRADSMGKQVKDGNLQIRYEFGSKSTTKKRLLPDGGSTSWVGH